MAQHASGQQSGPSKSSWLDRALDTLKPEPCAPPRPHAPSAHGNRAWDESVEQHHVVPDLTVHDVGLSVFGETRSLHVLSRRTRQENEEEPLSSQSLGGRSIYKNVFGGLAADRLHFPSSLRFKRANFKIPKNSKRRQPRVIDKRWSPVAPVVVNLLQVRRKFWNHAILAAQRWEMRGSVAHPNHAPSPNFPQVPTSILTIILATKGQVSLKSAARPVARGCIFRCLARNLAPAGSRRSCCHL